MQKVDGDDDGRDDSDEIKFMQNRMPRVQTTNSANDSPSAAQPKALRLLFALHAALTFAAGVILIVAPELISGAVGIALDRSAYLVCYLLAASEFCIAVLSWGARNIRDAKALKLIVAAFIVFHLASGVLEIYAFVEGAANASVWANIAVRAAVGFLFAYYGFYKVNLWKQQ